LAKGNTNRHGWILIHARRGDSPGAWNLIRSFVRRFAGMEGEMSAAVGITRMDHTAASLRGLAAKGQDAAQSRRLLAIAIVLDGSRREDAD